MPSMTLRNRETRVRCLAFFRLVCGGFDSDHAPVLFALPVYFFQGAEFVHAMNEIYELGHVFDLIGLNVTYHMPADILGKFLVFVYQFLNLVFAKDTLTCFVGLQNVL